MLRRASLALATALIFVACSSSDDSSPEDSDGPEPTEAGEGGRIDGSVATRDGGADTGTDGAVADSAPDVADSGGDAGDDTIDGSADGGDGGDGGSTDAGTDDAGDGGDGGPSCVTTAAAEIVTTGAGTNLLLRGLVVTPDQAFTGEVLINGDTITCVAAQCPGGDTIVDTHGIIFPGLIDAHNHILYDIFDETDWSPTKSYANHEQWTNEPRYEAMVDAKQYLNGESGSPFDYGCELDKYGELKGIVAGTTSIVGAANPTNRACYGSLARTIDQTPNGLGLDTIQVATLFPTTSAADGVCTNFSTGKTTAYVIHVAEGTDATALTEFGKLYSVPTNDGCLYDPKTTIVHGTALGDAEFTTMGQHGMSLVWSPRSNVFLYGGGVDLSKTTNVPLALSKGVNVALAPDWSIGGSQNILDELRFANQVDDTVWGNQLDAKALVEMVTTHAAKALGLDTVLGSIAVGKKADLMVIGGDSCLGPYDSLLAATPRDVRLVLVGGKALYGDAALKSLGSAAPPCEDLAVCGANKFACVATTSKVPTDKLDQSLTTIEQALTGALSAYDDMHLTQWTFSPITPLVRCQ